MGKVHAAFDMGTGKSLKAKRLSVEQPKKTIEIRPEHARIREFITQNNFSPNLVSLAAPDSFDDENFKSLGTQLVFGKNGKGPRTIMVTSAFPDEGKSYVAANLAVSIALGIDKHVLAVDCDLRRPVMHRMLGCPNASGLHELLMGKTPLHDLIIRSKIKNLSLLPAGSEASNPTKLFSSVRMQHFLEKVKGHYQDRFIIIDAPPVQLTTEPNILARHVDGIIFVIMAQRSDREAIQKSIEDLGRKKILGIFFNGYNRSHKSYHKYCKKYYGKDYYRRD